MINFKNKTILITGGTGSFGSGFINYVIKNNIFFKKIIILSRDEYKQDILEKQIPKEYKKKFRFFLGDIRERIRLIDAFQGVDLIIHAAALKQVPKAEYDPFEFIKTNILGSENVISAALESGVKKVIALSTDKASSPINLYGATKLCADKLFLAANNIKGLKKISFSVVRYGNVFGSRGSIFDILKKNPKIVNMTNEKMTRFHIVLDDAIKLCIWALRYGVGGEIIVPKLPSYKLTNLIQAIVPKAKIIKSGMRPGEKIHEEMISVYDSNDTLELKDKYIICGTHNKEKTLYYYLKKFNAKKVEKNFSYSSENNIFLNLKQIKKITLK